MDLSKTAGIATAVTAVLAYLDAKYHLSKDISTIRVLTKAAKDYEEDIRAKRASLFYTFEDNCKTWPEMLALWSRHGSYTRKEAYERVLQYGNYFLSLGMRPGDLAAVYLINCPEFMFIWIGLWSIGCSPAFVNYNLAAEPLVHCVKISGAKVLIGDSDSDCQQRIDDCRPQLENELGIKIHTLSNSLKEQIASSLPSRPDDSYREVSNSPNFVGALVYTSGTTGLPKAFNFSMGRFAPALKAIRNRLDITCGPNGDIWYNPMPYYHATGAIMALQAFCNGSTLAIGRKFSVNGFWEDVRDSKATAFVYVGETARYLLAAPPSPKDKDHSVRVMYGNGLRPDVWFKFQERFGIPEVCEFFNSTEGMMGTSIYTKSGFGAGSVGHHGLILRRRFHNIYVPARIDQETGDLWRDPETGFAKRNDYKDGGEILVKMQKREEFPGYWKSKAASDKKFVTDVFQKGDLYFRPGDALKRDDDGLWYFMDRLGDTFRWKGENVSTAEVALILGSYPGVNEANVYGVTLPKHDGRAGCAAIVLSPSEAKDFNWRAFAKFVKSKLPKYAVPVFIRVTSGDASGMGTHNNKQNKVPLRAEGVDPSLKGTEFPQGSQDQILWLKPKAGRYVPFNKSDWQDLETERAKL